MQPETYCFLMSVIAFIIARKSMKWYGKWQDAELENERLKRENESLKMEIEVMGEYIAEREAAPEVEYTPSKFQLN